MLEEATILWEGMLSFDLQINLNELITNPHRFHNYRYVLYIEDTTIT